MPEQNGICSYAFAKKLKELGIKQHSIYYYLTPLLNSKKPYLKRHDCFNHTYHAEDMVSAFTMDELMQLFYLSSFLDFWISGFLDFRVKR